MLVVGAGVALAVWGTWPLATCLDRCVAAPPPGGVWWIDAALRRDVDLIVWILAWGAHALGTAPTALFDANVFHPAPHALTTTEHLLGLQVLYLPLRLVTGDPVAAHQTTLLATFAAAFATMVALVRAWTGSWLAAAAAGVLYAFSPFRARHLPALHMESAWLLPLIVLGAQRVASGAALGWTLVFGVTLAVQALSSYYLGYASAVAVAVLLTAAALDGRQHAARLLSATIAALGVVAVVSVPYLRAHAQGTLAAADPQYVAAVAAVPGRTGATLAVLLAAATIPWWRRGLDANVRMLWPVALALAGVAAHLLALGPAIRLGWVTVPGPFALLDALVPGFGLVRGPERLNVVVTVAAAALAAVGLSGVARSLSPPLGRAALGAGLGLALASVPATMRWPVPVTRLPLDAPPVYAWLARAHAGPVLELPWHDFESEHRGLAVEARRMRYGTTHWRPLLGGYSGYAPPSYPIVSALAGVLPDPRALSLLVRATGLRWIVLHRDELDRTARRRWRAARALVRPVAVLGRDVVLEPRTRPEPDLMTALVDGSDGATLLGAPLRPLPAGGRRADVTFDAPPRVIPWLDHVEIGIGVTNRGDASWPATATAARHRVQVGYRWLDGCDRPIDTRDDGGRLPWDVAPGETVPARVVLRRPRVGGTAGLAVGIVQDGVWMDGTAVAHIVPPDPGLDCISEGTPSPRRATGKAGWRSTPRSLRSAARSARADCGTGAEPGGTRVTSLRTRADGDRDPAARSPEASSRCTAFP